ncbi:MAG: hypothetical protein ACRELY_24350 [Polyangiaceae bacterium]
MNAPVLRTRDFSRTTLKPRHRVVVRAMAEALFTNEEPLTAKRLDDFVIEIDKMISPASKTLRWGLMRLLELLSLIPVFVIGKLAFFENMSLADRLEMLQKLERSQFPPFLLSFVAYKTLMSIVYFEEEEELTKLGYPGPARERYKRSLRLAKSPGHANTREDPPHEATT